MTEARAEQYSENMLLEELIQSNDKAQIEAIFTSTPPAEIARMISVPKARSTRITISSMPM